MVRTRRTLFLAAAAAWMAAGVPACALNSGAGTSGAQFLKLGAGARAGAMAEAQLALAQDVTAGYYNPAGLAWSMRPMAGGMHNSHFQGLRYDFVGFSFPFQEAQGGPRHALALAAYNLSAADIERRTEDSDVPVGTFGVSDSAYALSYAFRPVERLALGATLKHVRTKLDTVTATAYAADAGLQVRLWEPRKLSGAFVVRNAGTKLEYSQGSDPLPLTFGAGLAAEPVKGLSLAVDAMKARDTDLFTAYGAEYRVAIRRDWTAALRGGYSTHYKDAGDIKGWTMGAGLTLNRVTFDFAFIPFGDLGNTFKYSLLVRF